jgi:hypothetical protein
MGYLKPKTSRRVHSPDTYIRQHIPWLRPDTRIAHPELKDELTRKASRRQGTRKFHTLGI